MKTVTGVLLLLIAGLGFLFYRQQAAMRELQKQIASLNAQLLSAKEAPKVIAMDLQEKCADGAPKTFRAINRTISLLTKITTTRNCRVLYSSRPDRYQNLSRIIINRTLLDAFEGRTYAEYSGKREKGKKYWGVAPFLCKVILLSGEEKSCKSMLNTTI